MADTYTSTLGVILMGIGGDNNTWGTNLNNSVFQIFEDAIANALTSTVTGGTLDLSTNPPPNGPSQARYAGLIFNGTLTSNQIVKVPNVRKWWYVNNATSGAFTLKFQTPSGVLSTAIPQNSGWQVVKCDGNNNVRVWPFNTNQIQMPDGSAAAPVYSDVNETNSGWYRNGTQDWRLSINGSDVLQVTGAGASSPSIVNILSPNALQFAGASVGYFTTGDVKLTLKTTADAGWVMMNDSTIGDASSNASYANAAASALFQLLYNNIADADAPILTSGGSATTRGAQGSAATAFANHCRLTLPLVLGRALAGAGSGAGLTSRTLGHALGEETHTLTVAEIPAHTHTGTSGNDNQGHTHTTGSNPGNIAGGGVGTLQTVMVPANPGQASGGESQTHTHAFTTDATGGVSPPHNNMQPSVFLNVMIKL